MRFVLLLFNLLPIIQIRIIVGWFVDLFRPLQGLLWSHDVLGTVCHLAFLLEDWMHLLRVLSVLPVLLRVQCHDAWNALLSFDVKQLQVVVVYVGLRAGWVRSGEGSGLVHVVHWILRVLVMLVVRLLFFKLVS